MTEGKVSIIIPCYNGASTIAQAIRGVLNQTYRPIELILVNDGSTDGSESVITGMQEEIEKAGIEFRYCPQQNMGLGGAINSGLKQVTGAFLAWCDADDELMPQSVEKRVRFLENHPEFGSVSSNAVQFRNCEGRDQLLELATTDVKTNSNSDQFLPMLLGKSLFCSGCHLVKTEVFRESHGGMEIYPARHGQNWQMLLPVYYTSKHAFINEPMYKYRTDDSSMSSQVVAMPFKQFYKRQNEYVLMVQKTLDQIQRMPSHEKRTYIRMFKKRVHIQNLDVASVSADLLTRFVWKCIVKLEQMMG